MKKITLTLLSSCFTLLLYAQNVGIGTTTPTYPLTVVANSADSKGIAQKSGTVEVGFFTTSSTAYVQTWSPHDLNFATNNGNAKISILNSNGFVGINTAAPSAQLDVNGTLRIRGNGAAAGNVLTSDAAGNATWQPAAGDIYSVGSVDFKADESSHSISISGGSGGAYYTVPYYSNLVAPVHLPNKAKVTQITVWYLDNSSTEDINFTLYGEYNSFGSYTSIATGTSSGATTGYRSVNLTIPNLITINNALYAYQVNGFAHWPGNSTMSIKNVQIQYTF